MQSSKWYRVENTDKLVSPALIFYPDRIDDNISRMIEMAGDSDRLWPHIKTHKCKDVVKLQQKRGINKFKCATLSEAQLLGRCKAKEVILAIQPTRVHLERLFELSQRYQDTSFSTLVDHPEAFSMMSEKAAARKTKLNLWLDINNGMNRTGIEPGNKALELFEQMENHPWILPRGFHVYDGHIRDAEPEIRKERCYTAMQPVEKMRETLFSKGITVKKIIAGGSPSFPLHAANKDYDLSPGTTLLWDAGYGKQFKDQPFLPAATLLTRIISKPSDGIVCTDLGHKSVASEMSFPRVELLENNPCIQNGQSEEHLILACGNSEEFSIGDILYAIPVHICPTVSKHMQAQIVKDNKIIGTWKIYAHDHDFSETELIETNNKS